MTALFNAQADVTLWRPGVGAAGRWYGTTAANLAAAKAAAQSGDTIVVGPGTYTVTASLLKNGVNWQFAAGAVVQNTTGNNPSAVHLFDDLSGPVVCSITGAGQFVRNKTNPAQTGGGQALGSVFSVTNAGSNISVRCQSISSNNAGTSAGIFQSAGELHVTCDTIAGNLSACTNWTGGTLFLTADKTVASNGGYNLWSNASSPPSGYFWANVKLVDSSANNAVGQPAISQIGTDASTRMWVYCEEVVHGADVAIQNAAGLLYVTAQKVFGNANNVGGNLYLTTQKISNNLAASPGTTSLLSCTGGKVFADVGEFDDANLQRSAPNNQCVSVGAGTLFLRCLSMARANAGAGVSVTGGTAYVQGGVLSMQGGSSDLIQTGGTLNVTPGVVGSGASGALVTSGTITRLVG